MHKINWVKLMHFYFVGIKGAGMSALANILVDLGHEVSGVDYRKKYFTEATFRDSIKVENFDNFHLEHSYFYVIGNAFKVHELTKKIQELKYNYEYYPKFLESFFKMKKIGISGSHGKTTTTYFTSQLIKQKLNVLVGDGYGCGNEKSEYFLFEACEYQNHFLNYTYDYLVILNIDYDHPDFFNNNTDYVFAFQKAALNTKTLIVNNDDYNCKKIVHKDKITFGFSLSSDIVLSLEDKKLIIKFDDNQYELEFDFYGKYMAYNLAAAFIVSYLIEGDVEFVNSKVNSLKMPARRFAEHSVRDDLILVNDYAHHPTEISVILKAIKQKYPTMKLVVIYQGHTHSRTKVFCNEYVESLKNADEVYIMPTFSSIREEDLESWLLADADKSFKRYDRNIKENLIKNQNLVIVFLGAGDIDTEFNFFK